MAPSTLPFPPIRPAPRRRVASSPGLPALVAAFALGRLASRPKRLSIAAGAAGLVLLGAAILLVKRQELAVGLARAVGLGEGIHFLQVWFAVPVIFVFAALGAWLPKERDRRALRTFGWFIAAVAGTIALAMVARPFGLLSRSTDGRFCRQTSDYSCGAASAANFLRIGAGIAASEEEMARECSVIPLRGVLPSGAWWGVEKKLRARGLSADLLRLDFDGLLRQPAPILLPIRLGPFMDHMVLVTTIGTDGALVIDPLCGEGSWKLDDLRERWLEQAIVIRRP